MINVKNVLPSVVDVTDVVKKNFKRLPKTQHKYSIENKKKLLVEVGVNVMLPLSLQIVFFKFPFVLAVIEYLLKLFNVRMKILDRFDSYAVA